MNHTSDYMYIECKIHTLVPRLLPPLFYMGKSLGTRLVDTCKTCVYVLNHNLLFHLEHLFLFALAKCLRHIPELPINELEEVCQ